MVKVLFVCLGNICRSPMAEGLLLHFIQEEGLTDNIAVDSCGTSGWHEGERPDRRMEETARKHGVVLPSRSRKIQVSDFTEFDYIIPMDSSNLKNLERIEEQIDSPKARVIKMRHFDPESKGADVPDPYYGGNEGFENVYQMLHRANKIFLDFIKEEHKL